MHAHISVAASRRTLGQLAVLSTMLLVAGCSDEVSTEPKRVTVPTKPSASIFSAEIQTEFHNSAHQAVTVVPSGTSVHPKTYLTFNGPVPTGNVRFHWYTKGSCDDVPTTSEPLTPLDPAGQAHPTTFGLNSDTYVLALRVEYDGDANYAHAFGECLLLNASGKQIPSISTVVHGSAHQVMGEVPYGSDVHPKAVITGANGTPTGKVAFRLFVGPCTGTPFSVFPATPLDASGSADAVGATKTGVNGTWSYQAFYTGDDTYAVIFGPCVSFSAVEKQGTIPTLEIHDDNHQPTTSISPTATIHGRLTLTGDPAPSGGVTIQSFANASCLGVPVGAATNFVTNGAIDPLGGFGALPVGTVSFNALYGGNETYVTAQSNCVTVTVTENRLLGGVASAFHNAAHQATTTLGTSSVAHVTAAIQGGGPTPTGQMQVRLFTNGACGGVEAGSGSADLDASGAIDFTSATLSGGTIGAVYSARVNYAGDQAYLPVTGPCMPLTIVAETITLKLGSIGFWRNWRNKFTASELQQLIDVMKMSYAPLFNRDLVAGNADDLTWAKVDAIYSFPKKPSTEQQTLAHFTSLAFDLALTQVAAQSGLPKPNDAICGGATLTVADIAGAATLFGTSTPTLSQVMTYAAQQWSGTLAGGKPAWTFTLTKAQLDTVFLVLTKINDSSIIVNAGC